MTPHRGNTILFRSSQQLPRLCLGPFVSLQHPRTFNLPRALLPELQRYKDPIRCAALGAKVPGHCQEQLMQTLIVRLLKTYFFTTILDCEKSTEYSFELVFGPDAMRDRLVGRQRVTQLDVARKGWDGCKPCEAALKH